MTDRVPRWGRELAHPAPLAAVLVLAVNDHFLKHAGLLPGVVTGKLSDFAGLFFFPVLVFVIGEAITTSRFRRRAMARFSVTVGGAGFAAVKTWPALNAWVGAVWGPMALDPTDLVALVMLVPSYRFLLRRDERPVPWVFRRLALVLAAWATIATPQPQVVRSYPAWKLREAGAWRIGCANIDAWVSKSGKSGVGVTLQMESGSTSPCAVRVERARIEVGPVTAHAAVLPVPRTVQAIEHAYVPFEFDNEALWNDDFRAGELVVAIRAGSATRELRIPMDHTLEGFHRMRRRDAPEGPDAAAQPIATDPDGAAPRFAQPPSGGLP